MTANETAVRNAYRVAENKDVQGWVNCFTSDGTFTDESIGVTYRGPHELGRTVEIYATAFPDMHRELFRTYAVGDMVVVELALQGTHKGPLALPLGTVPPTGKRMDAPCCDVFRLKDGKDSILQLLSVRDGHPDAAGRPAESRSRPDPLT
jgi:ketosteroid isomerase-like protein